MPNQVLIENYNTFESLQQKSLLKSIVCTEINDISQCEAKLAEMIAQKKVEIAEEKAKRKEGAD